MAATASKREQWPEKTRKRQEDAVGKKQGRKKAERHEKRKIEKMRSGAQNFRWARKFKIALS